MKPHSLRRGLWLANLALGAAVIGVAAWFVLTVRPEVAKASDRPENYRPPDLEKMRKAYESERVTGLKWKPEAPVTDKEIHAHILRADYKKKQPTHWIFSGPMPPDDVKETGPVDSGPPPPEGLDVLGKVATVIINPPNSTIIFRFSGAKPKSRAFGAGDWVRASDKDPERFKITKIIEAAPKVFEIHYAVYGKDAKEPERQGKVMYDRTWTGEYPPFLRPEGAAAKGPAEAAGAGTDTAAAGAGDGTTASGDGSADEPDKDEPDKDGTGAKVIDLAAKPAAELTLDDLKPEIVRNPRKPNQRAINFDRNSYRYFRGKKAASIAEKVKTSPAKDRNGRVIGLRITGIAKDAPADVFDVKRGDILVSINGQKVKSRADAVRIVEKLDPEKIATVVLDRNGKHITYRVDPSDPRNRRKARYLNNLK